MSAVCSPNGQGETFPHLGRVLSRWTTYLVKNSLAFFMDNMVVPVCSAYGMEEQKKKISRLLPYEMMRVLVLFLAGLCVLIVLCRLTVIESITAHLQSGLWVLPC